MNTLALGQEIKTERFKTAKIIKKIGEGGQCIVYCVDYGGEQMALKWFHDSAWKELAKVYDNLKRDIKNGSPASGTAVDMFLWPKDITECVSGTFGYIMDLFPDGYTVWWKYLSSTDGVDGKFFKTIVDVCIHIVHAFRSLHDKGYCYQFVNPENFFINPKSGRVLICGNDDIVPTGTSIVGLGTLTYMAPEIVAGRNNSIWSNTHTDEFSLSVMLFSLLCGEHPFRGKRAAVPCLTQSIEMKLYGTEPLFVFDPVDDSNRPHEQIHGQLLMRWKRLPNYVKETFQRAFSQEAIKNPSKRLKANDWLNMLARLRNEDVPTIDSRDSTDIMQVVREAIDKEVSNTVLNPVPRDGNDDGWDTSNVWD